MPSQPGDKLCSLCQNLIYQCHQRTQQGYSPQFKFEHENGTYRRRQAAWGCGLCWLSLQLPSAEPEDNVAAGDFAPATFKWHGSRLEIFEPRVLTAAYLREESASQNTTGFGPTDTRLINGPLGYRLRYDQPWKELQYHLPARTDSPESINMLRRWMELCFEGHAECKRSSGPLPTRVLMLGSGNSGPGLRLIETRGKRGEYIALSHRWGSEQQFTTTEENLDSHKRGIFIHMLPQVFRHAIDLLISLRIQYLWIDSLCIIQDSPTDWHREAGKMASIYSNALFTISATHAGSSKESLFHTRKHVDSVIVRSPLPGLARTPTLGIRVAYPSFDEEMTTSPLANRGWIYQERLLSPAILHCGHQLFWECKHSVMSQSIPLLGVTTQDLTHRLSKELDACKEDRDKEYSLWTRTIRSFSQRELTRAEDSYYAILGVSRVFRLAESSKFMSGLWQEYLQMELLWMADPSHAVEQGTITSEPRSPSWSWISIDYAVVPLVSPPDDISWRWDMKLDIADHEWNFKPGEDIVAQAKSDLTQFVLRIQGIIVKPTDVKVSARDSRQLTMEMRHGYDVTTLRGVLDPQRKLPKKLYLLRICSTEWSVLGELACFLLLKRVGMPSDGMAGSLGTFKRVGLGRGPLEDVRTFFVPGTLGGLVLV